MENCPYGSRNQTDQPKYPETAQDGLPNNRERNTKPSQSLRHFSFQTTGLQISLHFNIKEENSEISSFPQIYTFFIGLD